MGWESPARGGRRQPLRARSKAIAEYEATPLIGGRGRDAALPHEESTVSPEDIARAALQAALDERAAAGSPGAIIAIDAPELGCSFSEASGLFARGQPRALRPNDAFRAASVTKAVTAATAVRL